MTMPVMTSDKARIHFSKVMRWVDDTKEIVFVRRWKKRVVAIVPADWAEAAAEAIGPPQRPGSDVPPFPCDPDESPAPNAPDTSET